ncbi:MAG: hypothetical protein KA436_07095 [Oligoflexales bacterium]|nr:hypothetical protein [Oligoflexales bacterium]
MNLVVAFYKFCRFHDLVSLQKDLRILADEADLKGTILLAPEGINAGISGERSQVLQFLEHLRARPEIGPFEYKENYADFPTHRRMLVKIKKEIVTMRKENLSPSEDTGHFLSPKEFKEWQDEGREMILVDTRNHYEVALGKFKGALDPQTKSFGSFPDWVEKNLGDKKDKVIVTYCTGGIRCEKATAYMKQEGFSQVYQIQGGILQYFVDITEGSQAEHWEGDCVVFDRRKAVKPDLSPSEQVMCYVCLYAIHEGNKTEADLAAGPICKSCLSYQQEKAAERLQKVEARRAERKASSPHFTTDQSGRALI